MRGTEAEGPSSSPLHPERYMETATPSGMHSHALTHPHARERELVGGDPARFFALADVAGGRRSKPAGCISPEAMSEQLANLARPPSNGQSR
ncbi:MAG: hypothetical protein JWN48_5482 [Myxococcaceae bacterium]|nr:hypothetical protein [Myxococcaceae bacterium]